MLGRIFQGERPISIEFDVKHDALKHQGPGPSKSRRRAASLALAATSVLTLAKMIVAIATGSIGVLSEAIHSGLDLLSSIVTFFVVRESSRPADIDHPFGHGKIESLSAMLEAFLLLVAGGYIAYEGGIALFTTRGREGHEVQMVGWGLAVTAISVVVNLAVYFQNRHVARREESIAIETNAYHFLTDVFSSLAVFVGLALVHFTGWTLFDAIVAMGIAVYVTVIGIAQIRKCIAELSDQAIPEHEVRVVENVLRDRAAEYVNFHDLRTRKAGAVRYIDLHLEMCSEDKVAAAHAVCDRIEDDLTKKFKEVHVNIHVEPCEHHAPGCEHACPIRKKHKGSE